MSLFIQKINDVYPFGYMVFSAIKMIDNNPDNTEISNYKIIKCDWFLFITYIENNLKVYASPIRNDIVLQYSLKPDTCLICMEKTYTKFKKCKHHICINCFNEYKKSPNFKIKCPYCTINFTDQFYTSLTKEQNTHILSIKNPFTRIKYIHRHSYKLV